MRNPTTKNLVQKMHKIVGFVKVSLRPAQSAYQFLGGQTQMKYFLDF